MLEHFIKLVILQTFISGIPIDDPSEWPGHLEAFGSKQNTIEIKDVSFSWLEPLDFFQNFVNKVKPILFRSVYRYSTPVQSWTDDYLLKNPDAKKHEVMVEPNVIENRTAHQTKQTFHGFLSNYHKYPILTFYNMPGYLKKDVQLPHPLSCNQTSKHLMNANIVMSQGNAKSHVYNDDVETIYCVFQGTVDFLLIEYTKNKQYIVDKPQGGYSTVNVEKVDYTKYPNLRKIDHYIKVKLLPGDCLYIPYRWYKQYNSYPNDVGQSIAMNLWFKHLHDHTPVCEPVPRATLDKYNFIDEEMEKLKKKEENNEHQNDDQEESQQNRSLLLHFEHYVESFKPNNITFLRFYKIIQRDGMFNQGHVKSLKFPNSFKILVKELFERLDVDKDGILTLEDFEWLQDNLEKMEEYLEYQAARIEDYIEDMVESLHHDETIHAFDKRKMEEIRSARRFDEL